MNQITLLLTYLSDENSETLQILVAEVGAILNQSQTDRNDLEDTAFNPRTYDLRLVTEKTEDSALVEQVDELLQKTIVHQTQLSDGMLETIKENT